MSKERAGLIVDFSMECEKLSAMALSLSLSSLSPTIYWEVSVSAV
jgi:hypothetical protein